MEGLKSYLKSGKYLPEFMRDFYDQKDLFKRIDDNVDANRKKNLNERYLEGLNWINSHIYTVDFFLWFMAQHGYTLQRSRKKIEFCDIDTTLKDYKEKQM
jgi:hypothetical protein